MQSLSRDLLIVNQDPEGRPLSEPVVEKHGERATQARFAGLWSNRYMGPSDQHRNPSAATEAESWELAPSSGSIESQSHGFTFSNKPLSELCVQGNMVSPPASQWGSQASSLTNESPPRDADDQNHEKQWAEAGVLEMLGETLAVMVHIVPLLLGRVGGYCRRSKVENPTLWSPSPGSSRGLETPHSLLCAEKAADVNRCVDIWGEKRARMCSEQPRKSLERHRL